jgi:predicted Mrr-cat superfamily restriction endonuclease
MEVGNKAETGIVVFTAEINTYTKEGQIKVQCNKIKQIQVQIATKAVLSIISIRDINDTFLIVYPIHIIPDKIDIDKILFSLIHWI